MTRQTKFGIGLLLAFALAIAAYWYFSPYLVIHEINAAVRVKDSDALNDHVDYPRLRDSIKSQLHARLTAQMAAKDGNPTGGFAALGIAIATGFADRMVDTMVQPSSVMYMLSRQKLQPPASDGEMPAKSSAPDRVQPARRWVIKRDSANLLSAYAPDDENAPLDTRFGLVLERDGFANWKLVAIHLPAIS